jgi:hypothetical protein
MATRVRDFSVLQKHPDPLQGPSSLLFNEYQGSYSGVEQTGRESDHSRLSSDVVKKSGATILRPIYSFTAWVETTLLFHLWFIKQYYQ